MNTVSIALNAFNSTLLDAWETLQICDRVARHDCHKVEGFAQKIYAILSSNAAIKRYRIAGKIAIDLFEIARLFIIAVIVTIDKFVESCEKQPIPPVVPLAAPYGNQTSVASLPTVPEAIAILDDPWSQEVTGFTSLKVVPSEKAAFTKILALPVAATVSVPENLTKKGRTKKSASKSSASKGKKAGKKTAAKAAA